MQCTLINSYFFLTPKLFVHLQHDEELHHYVKVETEQAKKEDQGISQENQKVLTKIKQQQRQKHIRVIRTL